MPILPKPDAMKFEIINGYGNKVLFIPGTGNVVIGIRGPVDADPTGDGEGLCIIGIHQAAGDAGADAEIWSAVGIIDQEALRRE